MKKAHVACAAVFGPALGLAFAATNAMAATDHPKPDRLAPRPSKSVRLSSGRTAGADADCVDSVNYIPGKDDGKFGATGSYSSAGCLTYVHGVLEVAQTGLDMRVRIYKGPGATNGIYQNYVPGFAIGDPVNVTSFWSSPNVTGGKAVCMALVASKNHADVKYGPICLNY
jgi:hypothetical protein